MLNRFKFAVLSCTLISIINMSYAAEDCSDKRHVLEHEIEQAKFHKNYYKVKRLEHALDNVNRYCNNDQLTDKATQKVNKLERKLEDKKKELHELENDLNYAYAKGDSKKISKIQSKLTEKQQDIKDIDIEFNQAKAELASLKNK